MIWTLTRPMGRTQCTPLKLIFNLLNVITSLKLASYLDQWKMASITPVHKKDNKQIVLPLLSHFFTSHICKSFWKNYIRQLIRISTGFRNSLSNKATNKVKTSITDLWHHYYSFMSHNKFIYKCLNLDTPEKFHDWFKLNCDSHPYNTRSNFIDINNIVKSNNIFICNARTSFYGLRLIKVEGLKL